MLARNCASTLELDSVGLVIGGTSPLLIPAFIPVFTPPLIPARVLVTSPTPLTATGLYPLYVLPEKSKLSQFAPPLSNASIAVARSLSLGAELPLAN